jgi:hypothetical protein
VLYALVAAAEPAPPTKARQNASCRAVKSESAYSVRHSFSLGEVSMPGAQLFSIVEMPNGQKGFTVYGAATDDPPEKFCQPEYFQELEPYTFDGDLPVVKFSPFGSEALQPGRGRKYVFIIHHDKDRQISLTKLFEMPHDREVLRELAGRIRGLLSLVPGANEGDAAGDDAAGGADVWDTLRAPNEVRTPKEQKALDAALARKRLRERAAARATEDAEARAALDAETAAAVAKAESDLARDAAEPAPDSRETEAPNKTNRNRLNLRPVQ